MFKTKQIRTTENHIEKRDFGVFQETKSYGQRKVGGAVITWESDFVPISNDNWSYYPVEPGHYFCMTTSALRDGEFYGASQRDQYFKTDEERNAAVKKYFTSAEKRAKRKFN